MFQISHDSGVPVYQQIVQDLRRRIMTSKMHAHEKLVSVRALARQLNVNPNTVQKSYAILKSEGLIYSVPGRGDFVADDTHNLKALRREELANTFRTATKEARDSGMWIDEIFTIIDEAYSET